MIHSIKRTSKSLNLSILFALGSYYSKKKRDWIKYFIAEMVICSYTPVWWIVLNQDSFGCINTEANCASFIKNQWYIFKLEWKKYWRSMIKNYQEFTDLVKASCKKSAKENQNNNALWSRTKIVYLSSQVGKPLGAIQRYSKQNIWNTTWYQAWIRMKTL